MDSIARHSLLVQLAQAWRGSIRVPQLVLDDPRLSHALDEVDLDTMALINIDSADLVRGSKYV
ncbi:hypothetical protein [Krasilnikovia sp. M28-CT-15]|uniref:hypothetical protein n=1 Tax=Krasilnikovia sp. M28-CT-15 TaxID=3373540 RepID=UPI0038778999